MPLKLSPTATQCWLAQAESWVIANDGTSDPLFYDQTDPGGVFIRQSIGNTQTTIGTTTGNTVSTSVNIAPAIGSYALYTIAAQSGVLPYVSAYVGRTVLINNQLYYVQSYQTTDSVSGYFPVSINLVSPGGTVSDTISPNTTFYSDSNVVGFITAAAAGAIGGGGNAITTFPAVPSTGATTATFPAPSTGVSTTEVWNCAALTGNKEYTTYPSLCVGGTVSVGGYACTVTALGTNGNLITTITAYPQTSVSISGTQGIGIAGISGNYNGSPYTTPTLSFNSTLVGTMIGANPNYFTLTVSASASLVVGQILSTSSGVSTFKIVAISGNQIQCQTVTGAGNGIPTNPGSPTSGTLLELVTIINNPNGSAYANSQTAVVTYPTNNNSGTANAAFSVQASYSFTAAPTSSSPAVDQIVSATSATGIVYYFIVEGSGAQSVGQAGNFIYVQNLNDTPGNIIANGTAITSIPELPPGKMIAYGMGRVWMALPDGRSYMAGDIVGGPSGNQLLYQGRDAVLKVSENDLLAGGGAFVVPGNTGDIQGMAFVPQLDVSLGQGPLQVGTNRQIFSCNAPVQREQWAALTNPIQTVSLAEAGFISQDAVTPASGDLLFRSADGQIRSLLLARLDFDRWGNTPVSREMTALIDGENDLLMNFCSSVNFDNRLLMTANPTQGARGVYWGSIIALNFDPYSSMAEKKPAVYDGEWQGLNALKLLTGDQFAGGARCFALCLDSTLASIQLFEILPTEDPNLTLTEDSGIDPITSYLESPAMFDATPDEGREIYKRLVYGEIYIDELSSSVEFEIFYLSDQWPNWVPWCSFTVVYGPKNGANDPGFRPRIGLPKPDMTVCDPHNARPLCEGFTFQVKIQATGFYRFLGARFRCEEIPQSEYAPPICVTPTAPVVFTPAAAPILFAGAGQNPNGVCAPGNTAGVAFYYQDGGSVNLWFWSRKLVSWVPIISDQSFTGSNPFFTQGGQIIIGGLAVPVAAPLVPTQPALYYQDDPNAQLFGWSVRQQTWLPFITGDGANVTFPVVSPKGTVYRGLATAPTTPPNPSNAGALWVQDSPNIQLYAWSVLKNQWFGIIAS